MSISTTSAPVDCSLPPRDAGAQPGSLATPADAAAFANFLTAFGPLAPNATVPPAPLPVPLPGEFSLDAIVDDVSTLIATDDNATTPSLTAPSVVVGEQEIGSPIDQVVVPRRANVTSTHKPTVLAAANHWRPMAAPKPVVAGEDSAKPLSLDAAARETPIPQQDEDALVSVPALAVTALPVGAAALTVPVDGNVQALAVASAAVGQTPVDEAPVDQKPAIGRRTLVTAKTPAAKSSDSSLPIPAGFDRAGAGSMGPLAMNGAQPAAPATANPATTPLTPAPLMTTGASFDQAREAVASDLAQAAGEQSDFVSSENDDARAAEPGDDLASENLPIGSLPAGAARTGEELRQNAARGMHVRSFGGRMDRAADYADAPGGPASPERGSGIKSKNNTSLSDSSEGDANSSAFAGIAAANVTATMIKRAFSPAEQTTVAQAATSVATLSPFLASSNPEQPAAVAAPMVAVRAVMLAAERSVHEANPTVDLRFDLEGMDSLHVRVECRAGVVHTTFRSDSAEMREIISREWSAQTAQAESRGVRLAEPVFNTNTSPRSPDDSPSGRQRDRRSRETEGGAEIVSFNPRRAARGQAAATNANSPLGFHAVA